MIRHIGAIIVMCIGTTGLMSMLLAMNGNHTKVKKKKIVVKDTFSVKPQRRKPKKRKPKPRRRKSRPKKAQRAPAPRLASSLSSVSLDMPGIGVGDMDGASDQLLGQTKDLKKLVMTEGAVDQAPKPVHRVAPRYPARARARGITGKVVMKLLIDAQGQVLEVRVVSSQPAGVFDTYAVQAVRRWRFRAATYKGQPVKVWARQVLRFQLQ